MFDAQLTAEFVAGWEGFSATVYDDGTGVATIGYGETDPGVIASYRDHPMSQTEALTLLGQRLAAFAADVGRLITVSLNVNQEAALVSFAYNVGSGGLEGSTLRQLLNGGDYGSVRAQLMRWNRGGGKVMEGLTRRRAAEADLFETPPDAAPPTAAPDPYGLAGRTALVFAGDGR